VVALLLNAAIAARRRAERILLHQRSAESRRKSFRSGMTLTQAILACGGAIKQSSSKITISRQKRSRAFDLGFAQPEIYQRR